MVHIRLILVSIFYFSSLSPVLASDCSSGNIDFPETIAMDNGTRLKLNGVGSRTKFFLDFYIAALYLPNQSSKPEEILAMPGTKQIHLSFIKNVSSEKLIEGWQDGFNLNQSPEKLQLLKQRMEKSYQFFPDMKPGDNIVFELIPKEGTRVSINNKQAAFIEGDDFSQAVLAVWIGKHPPQTLLKNCLLGLN